MAHADIKNNTPYDYDTSFSTDENGRAVAIPIVKATFTIHPGAPLTLSEKQIPINFGGETWGDPETTSYKYEPEGGFPKPATDVVLIGHAQVPRKKVTQINVNFSVGPLKKSIRVTGDRFHFRKFGFGYWTAPTPFEKMPLTYERAFGGWDPKRKTSKKPKLEMRNPVGTGYRAFFSRKSDGRALPNLEIPGKTLTWYRRNPPPAGFGFTSPHWKPRSKFAGTFDKKWMEHRRPLMPLDFDHRYYNAASAGLVANGYLKGDERVVIENASPHGRLDFHLPNIKTPECYIGLVGAREENPIPLNLDTIIINTDDDAVMLFWRGKQNLQQDLHEVATVRIEPHGGLPATPQLEEVTA